MTHASLFSGIGGAELAASWMGWKNIFHCEINPFGRKVIEYHFPESKSYEDVTRTDFSEYRGRIDVLTAGFPCQPFSVAGQRKGADDDRYLWPEVVRVIREVRPAWVVGENVAGILTMVQPGKEVEMGSQTSLFGEADGKRVLLRQEYVIETICRDLESEGYSVRPVVIPACAVGAPHRRDRVWFIARRIASDTCRNGGQAETKRESGAAKENNEQPQPLFCMLSATDCTDTGAESLQRKGQNCIHAIGFASNTCCIRRTGRRSKGYREEDKKSVRAGIFRKIEGFVGKQPTADTESQQSERHKPEQSTNGSTEQRELGGSDCTASSKRSDTDTYGNGLQTRNYIATQEREIKGKGGIKPLHSIKDWEMFPTQSPVCGRNDGLPFDVDNLTIPFSRWRQESIKAYGNAWVPQVAYEIFKAIEESSKTI